ncbi:MAG: hypothetical protein ACXWBN_18915, partial [Acidimicrobiales bacterium]
MIANTTANRAWIRVGAVIIGTTVLAAAGLIGCTKHLATLSRPEEPVTIDGSALPSLLGTDPDHVVAFAWDSTAWTQVPVQVDQRDRVNPGQILHRATASWATLPDGSPFTPLVYTPPATTSAGYTSWGTYTPPDSDPLLDGDDEVTFLADDSGVRATSATPSDPPGVDAATRQEVAVTDPLAPDQHGYVYLFHSDTSTGGSAGTTGVSYTFSLDSGSYLATYKMGNGALAPNRAAGFNPEHSTITTGAYAQTYSDRWLNDGLTVTAGGAPGTPMLERGRYQFAPGLCGRSEDTFDGGATNPYEGAFIANISGPVRAIRSYIGANSGQYTVSTDLFYPQREDSIIELRVHTIPGVMAFDDMATATTGLTYSDDQNTGVPIDGTPDSIVAAHPSPWQMVSGAAGSLVTTRTGVTDIADLAGSTYYQDRNPGSPTPCTGDAAAWGQNGIQITGAGGGAMACTDPTIYGGS